MCTAAQVRIQYDDRDAICSNWLLSSGYMDEILLASIVLYKATKQQSYLDDTIEMYRETSGLNNHTEPLDWDNKVCCV